jgi:protein-L-isoaspartate(D-aspartate) O-methyltransferase
MLYITSPPYLCLDDPQLEYGYDDEEVESQVLIQKGGCMGRNSNRRQMMDDIEKGVIFTRRMIGRDQLAPEVMEAMYEVPREKFVPDELQHMAFDDGPLPIGHGQTISQPYIVALMTDLLQLRPEHRVLEIGTGSGYQAAILSRLCKQVYSMEVVSELSEIAKARFHNLGYNNIEMRVGDGHQGWPEYAPYDGIIVTAAAEQLPSILVEQLRQDGRLVIPVGRPFSPQELMLIEKDSHGNSHSQHILSVAFVPMVRSRG